jgi:hypothetical protein
VEEDASLNLLQSLVYTDDKWLRIRYSETTNSHPDFYALGSMMELILGHTNILAKSDNFSVHFDWALLTINLTFLFRNGELCQ